MRTNNIKKMFVGIFLLVFMFFITTTNKIVAGNFVPPTGKVTVSTVDRNIVQGLKETEIIFKGLDGQNQVTGFALEIDVHNPNIGFLTSYKDYDNTPGSWGRQTLRGQARSAQQATGKNIVAGFNTSYFNMSTGEPLGLQVMNGVTKQTPNEGFPYFFGVLKNGKPIIENTEYYNENKDEIKEASAGHVLLVENGNANVFHDDILMPRIGIGIKADGKVVMYTANGRDNPHSVGLTLDELAQTMESLGAVIALNLDGGGSATYISKVEGYNDLRLINRPSDGMGERIISSSLLVYSDAEYDGQFHHANISPSETLYTPESEVSFSAIGVDGGGGSATIPDGSYFALSDESEALGEISSTGEFISNGEVGLVTIQLKDKDDNVIGESNIEIVIPNELLFYNSELSFGFDQESDLGLSVSYNGKGVAIKNGDIIWDFDSELGTITNNIFKSSSSATKTGDLYARLSMDESIEAKLFLNIGQLPEILYNFENEEEEDLWISTLATVNGEKGSVEHVHFSSGEPVWDGEKSLKINFDFRDGALSSTMGVYAGVSNASEYVFPGQPTGIGMWVYGTEEAQGLWLRSRIVDGSNNTLHLDFTKENVGIDWLGWKYVEIPLVGQVGPFKIFRNGSTSELIRLMIVRSGQPDAMGKMTEGSIYVDNIRAVYGANIDDLYSPVIEEVEIDGVPINGQTVTTNIFDIKAQFHDDMNDKYVSGINYSRVDVLVDGISYHNREGVYSLDETKNEVALNQIYLNDGRHEVKVIIRDNFGNVTETSRYFTVNSNTSRSVFIEGNREALLGLNYELSFRVSDIEHLENFNTTLRITRPLEDYSIIGNDNFIVNDTFNPATRDLSIDVERKTGEVSNFTDDIVFIIVFELSDDLSPNDNLSYQINYGEAVYDDEELSTTFAKELTRLDLVSKVDLDVNLIYLGEEETIIRVVDKDGNELSGAEVFLNENGVLNSLGSTNKDGLLILTGFADSIKQVNLKAKHGDDISFQYTSQVLNLEGQEDGLPFSITVHASEEANNGISVGWFSNPISKNKNSILTYATKKDYNSKGDSAFESVDGTNNDFALIGSKEITSNYGLRVNSAEVRGLLDNETYVYKVGNGEVWSEIKEFKTSYKDSDLNFMIIGDIQTDNFSRLSNLTNQIENGLDYDFVIQTGDYVDNPTISNLLFGTAETISDTWLGDVKMLHALGNHEYMGDANGSITGSYFNMPTKDHPDARYYSIDYGLLYIAVISYVNNESGIQEALDWLEEDSSNSDARWKILVTHNPIYYTNPAGGNGLFLEMAPKVLERAGFDFTFSGHDHTYSRTKPLIDGKPNDNGVIYSIVGAFGEKGYASENNPDFHFEIMEAEYNSVYSSVSVTYDSFRIVARDIDTDQIIDDFTKTKESTEEHTYTIHGDRLICDNCSYNIPITNYVGFVRTIEGNYRYSINGNFVKGFMPMRNDVYVFDEDGNALVGEHEVYGVRSVFNEKGMLIDGGNGFVEISGDTYYYERLVIYNKGWKEIDGKTYYFSTQDGKMRKGNSSVDGIEYNFAETGHLKNGTWIERADGMRYYFGGLVKGWREIDGYMYYFSQNNGGIMATGERIVWLHVGTYTFNEKGQLIKGTFKWFKEGTRYYIGDQLNGEFYKIGFTYIDGNLYYFDSGGYMVKGIFEVDGVQYDASYDGIIRI